MPKSPTVENLLSDADSSSAIDKVSFEDGLRLLEELVQKVESGALSLDKSILCYERGSEMLRHLRGLLAGAEEKLKLLQKNGSVTEV